MPVHVAIKQLLMLGVKQVVQPRPPTPHAPAVLQPLVDAAQAEHRPFNRLAVDHGHRYRSAFWAIYLLSAFSVLCSGLSTYFGDDPAQHTVAWLWSLAELVLISTVLLLFWLGHRGRWQARWLAARTHAELCWYLPLLAPLLDFTAAPQPRNWYARLFDPGQHLRDADQVDALCERLEPLARSLVPQAWADPSFARAYGRWAADLVAGQRHYHRRVAHEQHALAHRIHLLTTWLFALTALCALLHLFVHIPALSVVSVFMPALGAGLSGALAQSECHRLELSATRLHLALGDVQRRLGDALERHADDGDAEGIRTAVTEALALIIDEHQDWHLLVRPHHIQLA